MKILIALIIFSAIILFHELGHFLLAKKNGIVVTEFSLGMGPRLLSKSWGGTRYSLKLLPFGGSCAMLGEDLDDTQPGSFSGAPVWGRISVVAAGPIFNFILAFLLAIIIVAMSGSSLAVVQSVQSGTPAAEAGFKEGDRITCYDGYYVDLWEDFLLYWYLNPMTGEPVNITVDRNGEKVELLYTPQTTSTYLLGMYRDAGSMTITGLMEGMPLTDAGLKVGDTIVGINGVRFDSSDEYDAYIAENPLSDEPVTLIYVRDGLEYETTVTPKEHQSVDSSLPIASTQVRPGFLGTLKYSLLEVKSQIRTVFLSLKELVTGHLGMKDLSGPVGVVTAIGDTYEESKSEGAKAVFLNLLYIAVLLSANLGVMNLLPIPALDGGRLIFLLIEAIRRKPGNRELEGAIHFAGMMLLMLLMVVIMYNDVLKLF